MSHYRKALLNMVNGEPQPEIKAPRQFVEDFEIAADHYGLKHIGEYLIAKDAARSDLENAQATYAAMAEEIRKGNA